MERRDVTAPRTPSDLEYRYGFGQSFAELMGVSNDARILAEEAEETAKNADEKASEALRVVNANSGTLSQVVVDVEGVKAEVVGLDGKFATIGLSYDDELEKSVIDIVGNMLSISSDYFSLTYDGKIKAEGGSIGGWLIDRTSISKTCHDLKPNSTPDSLDFFDRSFHIASPSSGDSVVLLATDDGETTFSLTCKGDLTAKRGYLGSVKIDADGLSTSDSWGSVKISSGKIETVSKEGTRYTQIDSGFIKSYNNTTDPNVVMTHYANGTTYVVYIDTATKTLKIR